MKGSKKDFDPAKEQGPASEGSPEIPERVQATGSTPDLGGEEIVEAEEGGEGVAKVTEKADSPKGSSQKGDSKKKIEPRKPQANPRHADSSPAPGDGKPAEPEEEREAA